MDLDSLENKFTSPYTKHWNCPYKNKQDSRISGLAETSVVAFCKEILKIFELKKILEKKPKTARGTYRQEIELTRDWKANTL